MWPAIIGAASSLLGGIFNRGAASDLNQQNINNQMLFAQRGLQWRANDATKAQAETGINRLTLLGAPSASFSNIVGDTGLGSSISDAGQDIGRAVAAGTAQPSRADQLNEQLLEAKIANVNADTVRLQAGASALVRKLGQPGTANVPFPPEDPRGPVINMMQRARMPNGEIVWIPSEKAASPLQTLAASPVNAGIAAKTLVEGVTENRSGGGGFVAPGAVDRATQNYDWTYGAP